MNGVDITRLAPGWQVADAYDAVWGEISADWRQSPEPRPALRVVGQLDGRVSTDDEEDVLGLVAGYLVSQGYGGFDAELTPILDAICHKCRTRFAPGTWPGGAFPDRSAHPWADEGCFPCPSCGEQSLWIPSLQEAERRVIEAGQLREALARMGMDATAMTTARDLFRAGHGAEVAVLVGPSCVWFGSLRLGLGYEPVDEPADYDGHIPAPALVDRVITEPDIHFGTDAYEGQDPTLD